MNKELIIMKMQKPARVLATVMKVLYILTAIGAIMGAIGFASMYAMRDGMLELMTDPAVEQTADVQETIELLGALDLTSTVLATVYTLLAGACSFIVLLFASRLLREISEERATLMRTDYADKLKRIAILMLIAPILDTVFSMIIAFSDNLSLLMEGEGVGSDGSLWFAVILLVAAVIWKYGAMLHEIRERELREEYEAIAGGETVPINADEIFAEAAAETAAKAEEESRTFEGF